MRNKRLKRILRHKRITQKITGTAMIPRLAVFRSNKHIYAQLVDDRSQKTFAASSDLNLSLAKKKQETSKVGKLDRAYQVGINLAKAATSKKIKRVIFDRAGYKYHGRVRALAEGARKGGLVF